VEKEITLQQLEELNSKQLKVMIFEAYKSCKNSPSDALRSKYSSQLWVLIDKWCKRYLFKTDIKAMAGEENQTMAGEINAFNEASNEMAVEIPDVIAILVKEDSTIKAFDELNEFFMYLNRILINKRNEILEKQLPKGIIKIRVKEVYKIDRAIEEEETERNEKFLEDERIEKISAFMKPSEYFEVKNHLYSAALENVKNVFSDDHEVILNVSPEILKEAVRYVLENKRQDDTRDYNRALFTVSCIKIIMSSSGYMDDQTNVPDDKLSNLYRETAYLNELASVLDSKLLNEYKESGIKPVRYNVCIYHNPDLKEKTKNNVEVKALNDLNEFYNDLRIYLKKKYPEIFS